MPSAAPCRSPASPPRSSAGTAEALKPLRQAAAAARQTAGRQAKPAQAQGKQRAKYLLDGDNGFRQRTDRTARLEQSFRGKGLCSPR
ncbi:hypothetical protein ACVOMV_31805 [Mesorhizobium atlanticum]